MKRSFFRLVVSSVLVAWVLTFATMLTYRNWLAWDEERARRDGLDLIHALLDRALPGERADLVDELASYMSIGFAVISEDDLPELIGRSLSPGERTFHRASVGENWHYWRFSDGVGALAAGPIDPSAPVGVIPIGLYLLGIVLPLLAAFIALRLQREIVKVEKATEALSVGELDARVDNPDGPSNELAASFNAMAERLARLIRSRHELVQAVSHELGSPLSRLRFQLELLETGEPATMHSRCAAMARELDSLDELVAELLNYTQSDDVALNLETFNPKPALEDLVELARLDEVSGLELNVCLNADPDGLLHADRRLFQRSIENLLRNAVRYARAEVRVEVLAETDSVAVAVHDDGPGIPEAQREYVTQPFVRIDSHRPRKTGGVGLGLAIVSRIVNRHRGELSIAESPLGGACIKTTWPTPSNDQGLGPTR
ncbi:MAG: ATP-binding protein [Myxococcota bacterium]